MTFSYLIYLHWILLLLLLLHDLIGVRWAHRVWIVCLIEPRIVPVAHHVATGVRSNADSARVHCRVLRLRHVWIDVVRHSHTRWVHSCSRTHLAVVLMRLLTRRFRLNLRKYSKLVTNLKRNFASPEFSPVSQPAAQPAEVSAIPVSFRCPRDEDFPFHPCLVLDWLRLDSFLLWIRLVLLVRWSPELDLTLPPFECSSPPLVVGWIELLVICKKTSFNAVLIDFTMNLPLSQVLLPQLLLDVGTERHKTFVFLAVLRMITAKGDELLANGTATVSFPLAVLRVGHDAFHLQTRWKSTIGVATLTRVHQRLNAPLNWLLAGFLRVWLVATGFGWRWAVVEIETESFHFVHVANFLFAGKTEIEILKKIEEIYKKNWRNLKILNLHHRLCSGNASPRGSCSCCRCRQICLALGCATRTAWKVLRIALGVGMRTRNVCHEPS